MKGRRPVVRRPRARNHLVETYEVSSLSALLSLVNERRGDFLFRGQGVDRDLIPRLGRPNARLRGSLATAERAMFEEFKRQALPFVRRPPDNDWDWLAVAQHHGLPTRLLD